MTVAQEDLQREQEKLLPAEDLSSYAGHWVAVRERRVIASDLDPVSLLEHTEVHGDDVLWHVPASKDGGVYIL